MMSLLAKLRLQQRTCRWLLPLLALGLPGMNGRTLAATGGPSLAATASAAAHLPAPLAAHNADAPGFRRHFRGWPRHTGNGAFRPPRGRRPSPGEQLVQNRGRTALIDGRPIRRIAGIKALPPETAALRIPLRVSGIVTDFSGYKNSFYLQNGADGISVDRTDHASVQVGDRVTILGTTGPGLFTPVVLAAQVVVTGHGAAPRARRVTFRQMMGGVQDSQWVEVQGVVHSTAHAKVFDLDALILGMEMEGGRVPILLRDSSDLDVGRLVDATIRVRGVCSSEFNQKRQFLGMEIDVPRRSDLQVIEPAADDAFSIPITPVGLAFRFGSARHRIRVAGTVTQQTAGEALYLQQGDDGLKVELAPADAGRAATSVKAGTRVEAVGFPVMGAYSPVLADGIFRVVGSGAGVVPLPIDAGEVLRERDGFDEVRYGEQLVQLQGELVESHLQSGQAVWILRHGRQTFEAYLPGQAVKDVVDAYGRGSLLQLTGICIISANSERDPTAFAILLRSPDDIHLLRRASWWTPGHLFLMLSALLLITLVITLWVILLRERVRQQTSIIRESEGRFRYLAQHDGLTGLPNRNAILARLTGELAEADRRASGLCVALIDLDHFKNVNDSLGHLAGDEVLRQAAQRFSTSIRAHDTLGRYGGEEFLIVFKDVDGQMGVERCEAIRQALAADPILYEQQTIRVTCSIGISSMYCGRESTTTLIAQADDALYRAKSAGRNRTECWPGRRSGAEPTPGSLGTGAARVQISAS